MPPAKRHPAIDIIGFPMDLGANRRGVDMGPSALRIAGLMPELRSLGYRVTDRGDVPIQIQERQRIVNPQLKYLKEIVKTSTVLARKVQQSLTRQNFPLCIGGDHSIAIGSIAGAAAHCRKTGKTPGVLWIDAHTDMNTDTTTPSGNIHGMPLAVACGLGEHQMSHLLGFGPKIEAGHCVLLGIRRVDLPEKEIVTNLNIAVYTMADIDRYGMHDVVQNALHYLTSRVQHLHVSFDLDSVDPTVAGGVGTPVPGGLTYREAHLLMENLADCGCLASMDVAEVNPILDHQNQSARVAVKLLASALGQRIL